MRKFFYSFFMMVCASVLAFAQTTTPDGTVANATYQWKEGAYITPPAEATVVADFTEETRLGGFFDYNGSDEHEVMIYGAGNESQMATSSSGVDAAINSISFPNGFVFPYNNENVTNMLVTADGYVFLYSAAESSYGHWPFSPGLNTSPKGKALGFRFMTATEPSSDAFLPSRVQATSASKIRYWVQDEGSDKVLVVDYTDFVFSNEGQKSGSDPSQIIEGTFSFQIQMYASGKFVLALGEVVASDIKVGEVASGSAIYAPDEFRCAFKVLCMANTGFGNGNGYAYVNNSFMYNQTGFKSTSGLVCVPFDEVKMSNLNDKVAGFLYSIDDNVLLPTSGLGLEVSMKAEEGGEPQECQAPDACSLGGSNSLSFQPTSLSFMGNLVVDNSADSLMFVVLKDGSSFAPQNGQVYGLDTVNEGFNVAVDWGGNDYAVFYKEARFTQGTWYYFNDLKGLEEGTNYKVVVYAYENVDCENGPMYSPVCELGSGTTQLQNPAAPSIDTVFCEEGTLTIKVSASDEISDSVLVAFSKGYPIASWAFSSVSGKRYSKGDILLLLPVEGQEGLKVEVLGVDELAGDKTFQISDVKAGESYYFYVWSYRNADIYSYEMVKTSYYQPSETLPVKFGVDPVVSIDGVDDELPWAGWGEMNGWSLYSLEYTDDRVFSGNTSMVFYGSISGENPVYMQFPAFVLDAEKNLNFSMDYALVTGAGAYTMQAGDYIVVEYAPVTDGSELSWTEAGRIEKGSSLSVGDIEGMNRANVKATLGEGTWLVRLGFKATKAPCFADFMSMTISESSACVQPTLAIDSVNDDLAIVVWNTIEGAQGYEYRYAKASESIDSKDYVPVSDTSVTLSGLDSATAYNIQVRTKCGESNYSDVSVLNFSTMHTLPYKASYQSRNDYALLPGFMRYQAEGGEYSESSSGWFVTDAYFREPAGKTLAVSVNTDSSVVQLPAFYHRESVMPILSFDLAYNKYVDLKEGSNIYVYVSDEPSAFEKADTVLVVDYAEINTHDGKFIAHSVDLSDNVLLQKEGILYVSFGWESADDEANGMIYLDNIYLGSANCGEISSLKNDSVQEEAAYFSVTTDAYAVKFFYRVKGETEYDSTVLVASDAMVLGGLISNTEYEYIAKACADMRGELICPVDPVEGTFKTKAFNCPLASVQVSDSTYTSITYRLIDGSGWLKQLHVFGPEYDSVFELAQYTYQLRVEDLLENTAYKASIRTYRGNSFSVWSDTVEHSTRMRCPVPVLAHSQVTDNSAVITCSGSALSYAKEFRYAKQGENPVKSTWAAEQESISLTELEANTSYVYAARTVCAVGDTSAWSTDATFATLPEAGQCHAPENLDTVSVEATTATFEVESDILAKELYIFEQEDEEGLTFEWNTAAAFEATGLAEGTTYYATVRAVCGEDTYSDWSDTITFTTKVVPCPVPEGFDTVIVRETLAAFTTAELGLKEILVYAASETMDETKAKTWAADADGYEWSGLKEGTEYKAVVRAVCSETKKSAWTSPLTFTTKTSSEPEPEVCGVPTSLVAEADTLSASLKWTAGENNVSFMVRYKKADDDKYTEVASENDTLVLSNLDAKTAYVWSVCGVCEEGKSAYATDAKFTTLGEEVSNEAPEAIRFQVLAQNGMVHVLNPDMNRIDRVQILSINGAMISDVVVRSSDNVSIPVQGGRVVLVSVYSNGFRATYKVFVR